MRITRRGFLKAAAYTAGGIGIHPLLAAAAEEGKPRLNPAPPNPAGAFDRLFLLTGDPATGVIRKIDPATGTKAPAAALSSGESRRLILYHFNDFHSHQVVPHSKKGDTYYLAQMVQKVRAARKSAEKNEVVLFLSGGDDHIGGVLDELLGFDVSTYRIDPAYHGYSAAGLDAAVVGNHELDRGPALLKTWIQNDAAFPVLSANIHGSRYLHGVVFPACIGVAKGLRVGIIGLTTPEETLIRTESDPGLRIAAPVPVLRRLLPTVANLTDVVLLLSHVGYNGGAGRTRRDIARGDMEIAAAAADLTDKPVVLVGGHTHSVLNQTGLGEHTLVKGVPILQAGNRGAYLGRAELTVTPGESKISGATLIPMKKRDDRKDRSHKLYSSLQHPGDYDEAFQKTVLAPVMAVLAEKLKEVIGKTGDNPAMTTKETLKDRYTGECAVANFMNDAVVARSAGFPGSGGKSVDVALFNASGIAAGVPLNADLTFQDWYAVMPYADTLYRFHMTGAQLAALVESNAKRILREIELQGTGAVDPTGYFPRGYLHFSRDIRYTIRLGNTPEETTAENVTFRGVLLSDLSKKPFVVAISSYIAGGNEGWNGNPVGTGLPETIIGFDIRGLKKRDTGLVYRNEIIAYIRETGRVGESTGAKNDGRVRLA